MPDDPSELTIRLLGTPLVERDGTLWALSNQKAQALLFYLAATGQASTRDHLMALLSVALSCKKVIGYLIGGSSASTSCCPSADATEMRWCPSRTK